MSVSEDSHSCSMGCCLKLESSVLPSTVSEAQSPPHTTLDSVSPGRVSSGQ